MRCWETLVRRARLNRRYLGTPPWDTGVSPPELYDFIEQSPPGHALDVGCGTGTNLLTLAKAGWQVAGIDLVWIPVRRARQKLSEAGYPAHIRRADVSRPLSFERRFDLVLDIGCYHSLSEAGRVVYLDNLQRWLKPGGTYLLYAHWKRSAAESHGIRESDFYHMEDFLDLCWRKFTDERRPDGSGGRGAIWVQFVRRED